ncbi:hypothetical protein BG003_008065 [Podila horticola]|nr:hypothetical protein BG003_008065 [Podila horticola]
MDAVSTALSSQDILHHILTLGSLAQSDLRACCLVNSDWAATGLALLWRNPQCHTLLAFRLLLDTLRHEQDQPARVLLLPSTHSRERSVRRASTMHSSSPSARTLTTSQSLAILPTPYRPHCPPKEYGIPFHGKRSYHRAQFIRTLDLHAVAGYLSLHHLEILARSSRIGLRALDLHTIQLPFSEHLLAILVASKQLRSLTLGPIELPPVEDLSYLKPCLSSLTELRLMSCPDTVDDAALGFLLRHSPQLRQLEVHGEKFTDRSLEFIATTCVELESLVLETPLMTDVLIAQITTGCTKLRSWRLIDCTALSETTVELLETMYDWDKTPKGIRGGFAGLLTGSPSSIASLAGATGTMSLATSSSSTSLSSSATPISQSSSPSSSASSLSISAHLESDVSQAHKSHQQRQGSHNSMSSGSGGGANGEEHSFILEQQLSSQQQYRQQQLLLQPTAGLSTLEFRNCIGIHPVAINSILRAQPRLEHLTLGGPKITDEALTCLTEVAYPHLRTLELFDCSEVSDETMVATLFNCDRLTKVGIRGSNFTYRTFSGIAMHLEMLEELHLEHVRLIINQTLQDIMLRCSQLRVLKLWHCRNLTQDLFTDQMDPVSSLEVLEYMDKYTRLFNQPGRDQPGGGRPGGAGAAGGSGANVGWEPQVRFLQTLVIRFENLRVLRLGKIAETYVPVNLVSYLCQLDRLEKFSIFQNPCLDLLDLKELQSRLPTLTEVGIGQSDKLSEEDILRFNQSNHRPNVLVYRRLLESSDELATYAYKPNFNS